MDDYGRTMPVGRVLRRTRTTLGFVIDHPINRGHRVSAIIRVLGWQLWKRVIRKPLSLPFWGNLRFRAYPDSQEASLVIYTRLPEYDDMQFVLHYLAPSDVVVDVGANIGLYSLLAAAAARDGKVLAFEPHPTAAARLTENAKLNALTNITVRVSAVGATPGTALLTSDQDLTNHIVTTGSRRDVVVPMTTLDAELAGIARIAMVKVDTEGFELEILRGATSLLERRVVDVWLIEMRGLGRQYGSTDEAVRAILRASGYASYRYRSEHQGLVSQDDVGNGWNLLFVRDIEFVNQRLHATP